MAEKSYIETGVDKLVKLIEEKKKISTGDAAKALGVSKSVIDEWSDFLEEEKIISIEYKLATTYLVERKLSKKEVVKKAKEFHGTKDAFVRKIETTIHGIENDTSGIDELKEHFQDLKKEIGNDLGNVKEELKELENYERLKKNIDKQMFEQQKEFRDKINDMEKQLFKEKSKYKEIINDIDVEKIKIEEEKSDVITLKEKEKKLLSQLEDFKDAINQIRKTIIDEENKIGITEKHLIYFQKVSDKVKENVKIQNDRLNPLIEESKIQERKILEIQENVMKKVVQGSKKIKDNIQDSKNIANKFKTFLSKKTNIEKILSKIDQDKIELEDELKSLINKAHGFDLASKKSDVKKYMGELNKKFKEIEKKRNTFKNELAKLVGIIKRSL
jgi:DNA repair exonuclease SbcCD ATPase subunit